MFSDKLAMTHASCGSQLATMHRADPYRMDIRIRRAAMAARASWVIDRTGLPTCICICMYIYMFSTQVRVNHVMNSVAACARSDRPAGI